MQNFKEIDAYLSRSISRKNCHCTHRPNLCLNYFRILPNGEGFILEIHYCSVINTKEAAILFSICWNDIKTK